MTELKDKMSELGSKLTVFSDTNFDLGNTLTVIDKKLKLQKLELQEEQKKLKKDLIGT